MNVSRFIRKYTINRPSSSTHLLRSLRSGPEQSIPAVIFPAHSSHEELDREVQWVGKTIQTWLDDEWTPLGVHERLGKAAGESYRSQRLSGKHDATDLLLGLVDDLLLFDYDETFVNGFEVANKVIELLMLREGIDVCCTNESDRKLSETRE